MIMKWKKQHGMASYPYPCITDDLNLYSYIDNQGNERFGVETKEDDFSISKDVFRVLSEMDGLKSPKTLSKKLRIPLRRIECILDQLYQNDLVTNGPRILRSGLMVYLRMAPLNIKRTRGICNLALFMTLFAPVAFAIDIVLLFSQEYMYNTDALTDYAVPYYMCVIGSLLIHEFGHAAVARACNASAEEWGIILLLFFPMGAFVTVDEGKHTTRAGKVAIYMAGIGSVSILLLPFLSVCRFFGNMGGTIYTFCFYLFLMQAINLIPGEILDGGRILAELSGMSDLHERVRNLIKSPKRWKSALRRKRPALTYACAILTLIGGAASRLLIVFDVIVFVVCIVIFVVL